MRIRCTCGNVFEIDDDTAAGAVECPQCGKVSLISSPEEESAEPSEVPSGRACPGCGAALAEDAVLCIACGFDLRTGKRPHVTPVGGSNLPPPAKSSFFSPGVIFALIVFVILGVLAAILTCRPG